RDDSRLVENKKGDEPDWARPMKHCSILRERRERLAREHAGHALDLRHDGLEEVLAGSALMRATMSESPVVPMISWISGTFFNSLIVFCVSFERMRRYALLACPSAFFWVQSWSAG